MKRETKSTKTSRILVHILTTLCIVALFAACSEDETIVEPADTGLRMAVISDLHYYDPSLGMEGQEWQMGLFADPKLLTENADILSSLFNSVEASDAEVVLVPGDLTKDGEKQNHEAMAGFLRSLESKGKRVFVVPGNHDINNPVAKSFHGDPATSIPGVTAAQFAQIYDEFGYGEAKERDPASLSYVAELQSDLWLIAIDGCVYNTAEATPPTYGTISDATASWVVAKLQQATSQNIRVVTMMHHALVEHFTGQSSFPVTAEYVVSDWQQRASAFAQAGMKVLFSGHFHANDVVSYTDGSNTLYDVSTGSPLSAPCPWRLATIYKDGRLTLDTRTITNVGVPGGNFPQYATEYLNTGMTNLVAYMLMNDFGVAEELAGQIAPFVAGAYVANYAGDEEMDAASEQAVAMLNSLGDPTAALLAQLITSMRTDLPPADNSLTLTL
ncbi:metallophosphoesterase [bacterium]|nr:metallophosphoesterase [bacterium]